MIKLDEDTLQYIEKKAEIMKACTCLFSMNTMALSLSVDACRITKFLESKLEQWQSCLPLGEVNSINFSIWNARMWQSIQKVCNAYKLYKVKVNPYDYETKSFQTFKEHQLPAGMNDGGIKALHDVEGEEVPKILVCALRELNEALMRTSEFLSSPTEELIATSFEVWQSEYIKHYQSKCLKDYEKWKIQYSTRTLKKHLVERRTKELERFRALFSDDDEFERVFDTEQQAIDFDGLSRFLFTHTERFGESRFSGQPMLSDELVRLFDFIEIWQQMSTDLKPLKKHAEKSSAIDELANKVNAFVRKIKHLVEEKWAGAIEGLWSDIIMTFHREISEPGPHEKFRDFSKKTVYCIIGHLKQCGVYRNDIANAEVTRLLEDGRNTGMRKYVNNGVEELEPKLKKHLEDFIETSMLRVSA